MSELLKFSLGLNMWQL